MLQFLFVFFVVLGVLGILFTIALVLAFLFGNRLPSQYVGEISAALDRPVDDVWQAVKDGKSNPISAQMCKSVSLEADEEGKQYWIENISSGKIKVELISEIESEAIVRRSNDFSTGMESLCRIELRDIGDGCEIIAKNTINVGSGSMFCPLLKCMLYFFGLTRLGMKKYVIQIADFLETKPDFNRSLAVNNSE